MLFVLPGEARRGSGALATGWLGRSSSHAFTLPYPAAPTASAVGAVSNPTKPFAAIVGGSKVSSKIGVI